ncbi:hypothetical protein [Faecalibaculum rodentium]|uniref:hypothetical protein n=1 Tax=Faecalibaculum rodentium TaxID=1702221 RepID=UPI003F66B351
MCWFHVVRHYWLDPDGTKEIGEMPGLTVPGNTLTKSRGGLIDKVKKETGSEKVVIGGISAAVHGDGTSGMEDRAMTLCTCCRSDEE